MHAFWKHRDQGVQSITSLQRLFNELKLKTELYNIDVSASYMLSLKVDMSRTAYKLTSFKAQFTRKIFHYFPSLVM